MPTHWNVDNMPPSLADSDDGVLIRMITAGSADCFSVLVDRHLAAVKNYLRRIVSNQADLDDLIQDVLLKVWIHLNTFRSESNLRTWMINIGINRARELHRRRQFRPLWHTKDDFAEIASAGESPEEWLLRAEAVDAVRSEVAKLPPKYRRVIVHRDLNEVSGKEIAERLQITLSAVKTRIFRGRLILAANIRKSKRSRCSAETR
jgi:RNA polymerase sigma-70 factor (ECF subfamily)